MVSHRSQSSTIHGANLEPGFKLSYEIGVSGASSLADILRVKQSLNKLSICILHKLVARLQNECCNLMLTWLWYKLIYSAPSDIQTLIIEVSNDIILSSGVTRA